MGAVDDPHAECGDGLYLLTLSLLVGLALAGSPPRATLDAEVGERLDYVRGTLTLEAPGASVVDPLSLLPLPMEDRTRMRTFPGAVEQGEVTWVEVSPGTYAFHAWLPRRFGGVGATRHGLFANGAWYPQPVIDGETLPELTWDVRVRGPDDVVMSVGSSVGGAEVRWSGEAERASLAVVPHGVVERLEGTKTYVLAKRHVPRRLTRELGELVRHAVPEDAAEAVLVEAPLRRRLGRAGAQQALVSDRAFRLAPGLARFHRVGLAREVLPAFVPVADPVVREWVGASWAEAYAASLKGIGAPGLAQRVRWIPSIDWLLTSGTMPFYGEIFERRYLEDPLHDDLVEILAPHYPGPAVVQLLDDAGGPGTHRAVAAVLLAGASVEEAVPPGEAAAGLLTGWRGPVPGQDYVLSMPGGVPVVTRVADSDAPPEVVRIRLDDDLVEWRTGWGPAVWSGERPAERVVVDPGGHLQQLSRAGDRAPVRYALTSGGWIDNVNLTDRRLTAALQGSIRGAADLQNSMLGVLSTNEQDLARARVTFAHRFGRLLDGRRRLHRVALSTAAGWHHPWYRDEVGTRYSLGLGGAWTWSTQVASTFPTSGSYVNLGGSLGYAPEGKEFWGGVGAGSGTVVSWHPRWALASGIRLGGAMGSGDTRKLALGGIAGVRGLDPDGVRGPIRAVESVELRWAPIRQASVPVGFAWGTELQVAAGVEVGQVISEGQVSTGLGVVFGTFVLGDVLGLEPRGVGVSLALPVFVPEVSGAEQGGAPRVLIRWGPSL